MTTKRNQPRAKLHPASHNLMGNPVTKKKKETERAMRNFSSTTLISQRNSNRGPTNKKLMEN